MFVYADFAGELKDPKQLNLTYVTLICTNKEKLKVYELCNQLKNELPANLVDTDNPKFEFHAVDIFSGKGWLKRLSSVERQKIALRLKKIVHDAELRYVIIKIEKNNGGLNSLRKFSQEVENIANKTLKPYPKIWIKWLNKKIEKQLGGKGIGPLAACYWLLFGLTSGLLHWDGFRNNAELIVDKQFVKVMSKWNYLFSMSKRSWPFIKRVMRFRGWPDGKPPEWYFSGNAVEKESYQEYGIQLADFIAYTSSHSENPDFDAERFCISRKYKQLFTAYPGLLGIVASNQSVCVKYTHKRSNKIRFGRRFFI